MNTPTNPYRPGDDERPEAVRQADAGSWAWHAVVHAQRTATLDHADFYALTGAVVDTLRALESLAGLLARQVGGYGEGRALYDDEGGDPAVRLAEAARQVSVCGQHIAAAERAANRFWSAIGHIGVEVTS
jgi:hypothetical protein